MSARSTIANGLRAASLLGFVLLATGSIRAQVQSLTDVSPTTADTDPIDPDRASGGRVNGIAVDPNNKLIMYAASEWGGIYKSTNGGYNWQRLDGHRPVATWDVKVNPGNSNRVYATSFFDGRSPSLSGINVSTDGGVTWTHPATAVPPAGFCANAADQTELSAFGIAINPTNSANVFIGTSCGLAVSTDSGDTWSFSAPPSTLGTRIWSLVASADGGVVDTCGDSGHWFRGTGSTTWTAGSGLPSGLCSIAASPYTPNSLNLFVTVGNRIYETQNGGGVWTETRTNPQPQGRIPFLKTNRRSEAPVNQAFDLWFGDVSLYRVRCDTAANPKCGTGNTPAWSGGYTRSAGGHDDMGSIIFDPSVANDACPLLMSSDGGVYVNTNTTSPACHTPAWTQPSVTPRALWPWALSGANLPGTSDEHLYFGNQDNGVFGTFDAAPTEPIWTSDVCCDGFDAVASTTSVIYSVCCSSPRATSFYKKNPDFSGGIQINYPVGGLTPGFQFPDVLARWGDKKYAMLTANCSVGSGGCSAADGGLYITQDVDAVPIVWTELGNASEPQQETVGVCSDYPPRACTSSASCGGAACFVRSPCAVYAPANASTFYVQTGGCNSESVTDQMWKFVGTDPAGAWTQVSLPGGEGFGVFAVDPSNPNRLLASGLSPTNALMYRSNNGGTTWSPLTSLDTLMRGGGDFPIKNQRGLAGFTSITGYHQPSFVAFDPFDTGNIIAGGRDSGIFYTNDDGASWTTVTDPRNSHTSGVPHIPRPKHAYFSEADHNKSIYVSSQGRGVWRLGICTADGFEPDDGLAWYINSGVTYTQSLCGTGDTDFRYFDLAVPTAVTIETSGPVGDTTLELFDGNFLLIQFDDDSGAGSFSRIQRTCSAGSVLPPGRYFTRVSDSGSNDTIATYQIRLDAAACCGNGTLDAGEACDDGNTANGDCCSSTCGFEPVGTSCNDGNSCTTADTCSSGVCLGGPPPAPPTSVPVLFVQTGKLIWAATPDATGYDVVRGDLGALRTSGGNFSTATQECLANDQAPTEVNYVGVPNPGDVFFFLVRGANCSGSGTYDGPPGRQAAPRDAGVEAAPITCSTSCSRNKCTAGPVFDQSCGGCVASICAADPYCCQTAWDSFCVAEVRTVCKSLTCAESAGACSHTVCSLGGALATGCDNPPVSPSCVSAVCAADAYCCNNQWDSACVGEVSTYCTGYNCN